MGGVDHSYSGLTIPASLMMGGTFFDQLVIAPISLNDVTYMTFAPGIVGTLGWH